MLKIRTAGVIKESITDGPGLRYVIFAQGCPHRCKGCHNVETWEFNSGKEIEIGDFIAEIKKNPILRGVTFSGGEPICQSEGFYNLAKEIKKLNLDIVLFTGYTMEELMNMKKSDKYLNKLLFLTDLIIDGPFIEDKKDISLRFRGSLNQRIIDVKKSLEYKKIVVAMEYMI